MLQHLPGMEVLLVEDEPINQAVTRRQLEGWGIKVSIAANGHEALDYCSVRSFDAVLMDIQMPLMDGITATQILREREAKQNLHTPIIAFTAAALVGDRERFLACGMDDYISKPVDMNLLYACLRKYAKQNQ
jgi:CheY-like chemotaxis protein